ncbi:MAG: glycosyltransferase family 4 protein, partial [Candidatus Cloacimonadaceae bacterium]|nr:glycosyltransferase family 4 protein [Candidatus Cloacimonadaceae bacterium]
EGRINPDILRTVIPSVNKRFILKKMDYAFAIAEKEIDFIRKFNPKVEYSPVPILLDEYEIAVPDPRSELGFGEEDFVFLCLGRVSNIKGQDVALKAFARVAATMPEAKLVFVGRTDYEQDFYEYLHSFVTQNALQDRVFFTGMLDREKVLGWLRTADIHVIPVRFMNSGAVVVESWISDTPVIQSDVVDPNLVVEDFNGYLFPSENEDILAEKMVKAFANRSRLSKLAANGKVLVKTRYTYDYLIDLYSKTYKKLLNP